MPLLTTKDLAAEMLLHPRTVKRWWKRLGVPPDACPGTSCHRWTPAGAARLLKAWRDYWQRAGLAPETVSQRAAGTLPQDKFQLLFNFDAPQKISPQASQKINPEKSGCETRHTRTNASPAASARR